MERTDLFVERFDYSVERSDLSNDLAVERTDWIPHVYVSIFSRSRADCSTYYDHTFISYLYLIHTFVFCFVCLFICILFPAVIWSIGFLLSKDFKFRLGKRLNLALFYQK